MRVAWNGVPSVFFVEGTTHVGWEIVCPCGISGEPIDVTVKYGVRIFIG